MQTLSIPYPDNLPDALQETRGQFEQEARLAMAAKLFEMKRLSSGTAAKLAGIPRVTFLFTLSRFGVNMIDIPVEELQGDIDNG